MVSLLSDDISYKRRKTDYFVGVLELEQKLCHIMKIEIHVHAPMVFYQAVRAL